MKRFIPIFVILLLALLSLELTQPVQEILVLPWTAQLARLCAALLGVFDPTVISSGKVLQHGLSGAGVTIETGCNGIEAFIMLMAAVLAYRSSWSMKLAGLALGFVAIQAANVARVITLFYLVEWHAAAFEFAHLYVWQILIMLDVLVVWLVWIRRVALVEARAAARCEADDGVLA